MRLGYAKIRRVTVQAIRQGFQVDLLHQIIALMTLRLQRTEMQIFVIRLQDAAIAFARKEDLTMPFAQAGSQTMIDLERSQKGSESRPERI